MTTYDVGQIVSFHYRGYDQFENLFDGVKTGQVRSSHRIDDRIIYFIRCSDRAHSYCVNEDNILTPRYQPYDPSQEPEDDCL